MRIPQETKKYFVDLCARTSQVIFTLLIITPFLTEIFSWNLFTVGLSLFVLIVSIGAIISFRIEEG